MTVADAPLATLIGYRLRRAQVAAFADFTRSMADLALTPGQFGALVLIDANAGLSQTELGRLLGIDRSTVVPLIDRLQAAGLVERAPDPSDRRRHALQLTAQGRTTLSAATQRVRAHEARLAQALSPTEVATLLDALQRVEAAVSDQKQPS